MAQSAAERAMQAHIKTLEKQLEWTQAQLERALAPSDPQLPPAFAMESRPWTTEEEEEINDMLEAGLIDTEEATGMLEAVGALSTDIQFAS